MSQMNISRFADPKRTKTVDLGECSCPGTPHGRDTAEVRASVGDGEFRAAVGRGGFRSGAWNGADSDSEIAASFTRSWTLLGDDGEPMPVGFESVHLLDEATRDALVLAATASHLEGPLPNASGAPSPGSSRGSASRPRKARTPR